MRHRTGTSKDVARCGAARLIRSVAVVTETKEERMQPLLLEELAKQHIEDLHREAAMRRLARSSPKRRSHRRKQPVMGLQRAPAH
jgi:hypothetical protein